MSWFNRGKPKKDLLVIEAERIEAELIIDAESDPRYDVVFYKYSGFWCGRFRGQPLKRWFSTGEVEAFPQDRGVWTSCQDERQAWALCNAHLEQQNVPVSQVFKKPSYSLK